MLMHYKYKKAINENIYLFLIFMGGQFKDYPCFSTPFTTFIKL